MESVIACRNAMRIIPPQYTEDEFHESLKRAITLAKCSSNSGHPNFLCGIRVSFDIVYPQYFTPELQRYHFCDIVTSSSKMHRLVKLVEEDSFTKYVDEDTKDKVKRYAEAYNENQTYENWMKLLSNTPLGLQLFMRCTTNYLQLRNIFHQRKNHKLKEDWGAFCDMIRRLPYFNEFINPI